LQFKAFVSKIVALKKLSKTKFSFVVEMER